MQSSGQGKHAVVTAFSYENENAISRGVLSLPKIRAFMPVSPACAALPATVPPNANIGVRHPQTPARNGIARNRLFL